MTDGSKMAAATLAAEASRQQQELNQSAVGRPVQGRDISGDLLKLYRYFLTEIEKQSGAVRTG